MTTYMVVMPAFIMFERKKSCHSTKTRIQGHELYPLVEGILGSHPRFNLAPFLTLALLPEYHYRDYSYDPQ